MGHGQQSCWQSGGGARSSADMGHLCHHHHHHQHLPAAAPERGPRKGGDGAALPPLLLLLFVLLASSVCACKGAPMPSQALESEEDLQLLKEGLLAVRFVPVVTGNQDKGPGDFNEENVDHSGETLPLNKPSMFQIDDACSAYLATDSQPQVSSTVEELCFLVMGFLQKPQALDEKDNTKRFLFHYSKTHDSGNSDIMSSVLHPLLQLVPQLNERRLKRYKLDEELQGPGMIQRRGHFVYRPRNGRRSVDFR